MRRERALTAVLVACLLVTGEKPLAGQQVGAEPPQVQPASIPKLQILILEGEGAVNNIRRRVARESLVQVVDENRKPVAGAAVTFELPQSGASGTFSNNTTTWTVHTDSAGRASARVVRLSKTTGKMQIKVSATPGATGPVPVSPIPGPVLPVTTFITQTNMLGPWVLLGIPVTATTVAIGGAVVAAAVVGTTKALSSGGKSASISVGPPHF